MGNKRRLLPSQEITKTKVHISDNEVSSDESELVKKKSKNTCATSNGDLSCNIDDTTIKTDNAIITLEAYPEETQIASCNASNSSFSIKSCSTVYNTYNSEHNQDSNESPQNGISINELFEELPYHNENDVSTEINNTLESNEKKSNGIDNSCNADDSQQSENNIQPVKKQKISSKQKKEKTNESNDNGTYITLNKKALKKAIKLLKDDAPVKKEKFRRTCQEGYDHMLDLINWDSYAYATRTIRNLILNREWDNLKDMIGIMMKQKKIFKNYVKEITYLYYLINSDVIDPTEVEEYFQLSFSSWDKSKKPFREFDIWYKEDDS